MKINKKAVLIILGAAVLIYLVFPGSEEASFSPEALRTRKARTGEMLYTINATGTIEPLRRVEIKSIASGQIVEMPVDTGSIVRAGGLICRIDPSEEKNNLDRAKADLDVAQLSLEKAEADLSRHEELFAEGFISSADLEDHKLRVARAKSAFISARVQHENARKRYRETSVSSPIAGTILEKFVEPGQIISSGTQSVSGGTRIAVIADLSDMYIKALVSESDIARVRVKMPCTITVDAYPDTAFNGEVYKIEPIATVEQSVTSFLITIKVTNPQRTLKPGMNSNAEIIAEQLKDQLLVPYSAVFQKDGKSFVFIPAGRTVKPVEIEAGQTNFKDLIVLSGIAEGQEVVVSGLTRDAAMQMLDPLLESSPAETPARQRGGGIGRLGR